MGDDLQKRGVSGALVEIDANRGPAALPLLLLLLLLLLLAAAANVVVLERVRVRERRGGGRGVMRGRAVVVAVVVVARRAGGGAVAALDAEMLRKARARIGLLLNVFEGANLHLARHGVGTTAGRG